MYYRIHASLCVVCELTVMLNVATRALFNSTRSAAIAGRSSLNYASRSVVTLKEVKVLSPFEFEKHMRLLVL